MVNNNKDPVEMFLKILFIIFAIIFIIQISLKILGHSPTVTELLVIGFVAVFVYLLKMNYKIGRVEQKVDHVDQRLSRVEERLNERFLNIEKRLLAIEKHLIEINQKI